MPEIVEGLFGKGGKAIGLTGAQCERYDRALEEARTAIRDTVMRKMYSQIRKERTPDWKAAVELQKEAAIKELNEHPNIVAYKTLRDPLFKLNSKLVKERYPEIADQFPAALQKQGGLDPDEIADDLGYTSAGELIKEMILLRRAMDAVGAKSIDAFINSSANLIAGQKARELAGFDGTKEGIRREIEEAARGPAMEDFLIKELKEFQIAAEFQSGRKLPFDIDQIKSKADLMFQRMPVKNARNIKFAEKALQKTGRATEFALEKGNWTAAFKAKQQQFLNLQILRMTHDFVKATRKFQNLAKEYASKKSKPGIPQDYMDLIHSFLQEYGYRVPQNNLKYNYDQWAEQQRAMGQPVQPYAKPDAKDIDDLMVMDFNDVADRLENLVHLAKDSGMVKVLDEHLEMALLIQRALDAAKDVKKQELNLAATDAPVKWSPGKINSLMFNPHVLFHILDNRMPGGVFDRVLMQGARAAAAKERDIVGPEDQAIAEILKETQGGSWDRWARRLPSGHGLMHPARPGREVSLLHQDLIGIMLHMGNKEGRWHLEEGGWGWDRDKYEKLVLDEARPEDWETVDRIHAALKNLWPKIVEAERELTGLVPEEVKPLPIILHREGGVDAKGNKIVTVEVHDGGYFPLRRDDAITSQVKGKVKVDPGSLWAHFLQEGATPKGHTVRRVAASYVPSLNWLDTLRVHVPNVAKRIAYGKWALDALKFISQPEIVQLIEDVHGKYAWDAIRSWLQRQLGYRSIDPRVPAVADTLFREARLRTYMVQTGFKIAIMLEHATSVVQTASVAGGGTMFRGLVRYIANPLEASKFIEDSSDYMRVRNNEATREMRDLIDDIHNNRSTLLPPLPVVGRVNIPILDPGARKMREWSQKFFGAINQFVAANPAWIGAYWDAREGKAVPPGRLKPVPEMDHDEAVAYADGVVGLAHGSGMELDMGSWQSGQGNEAAKFVNMYNVFRGGVAAMMREGLYHGFQGQDTEERVAGFKQFLWAVLGIVAVGKIVADEIPQDLKAGKWVLWQLDNIFEGMSHMVPLGENLYRMVGNIVQGKPPEFEISPIEGTVTHAGQGAADIFKAVRGKKVEHNWIQNVGTLLGFALELPLGQPSQSLQTIFDMVHPNPSHGRVTRPAQGLIFGPSHESKRKEE